MEISGTFYTTVDASVANSGISTLAISGTGDPTGGGATLAYDVLWSYDPAITDPSQQGGFTGTTWFAGVSGSPIVGYNSNEEFNEHLSELYGENNNEQVVINEINNLLSVWNANDRWTFTITLVAQLPENCVQRY